MILTNLLDSIASALSDDVAIRLWAESKFEADVLIQVGMDEHVPPDTFPNIVISDVWRSYDQRGLVRRYEIGIGAGVYSEDVVDSGNIRKYSGFLLAEELIELAEEAIYKLKLPNTNFTGECSRNSFDNIFATFTTFEVDAVSKFKAYR